MIFALAASWESERAFFSVYLMMKLRENFSGIIIIHETSGGAARYFAGGTAYPLTHTERFTSLDDGTAWYPVNTKLHHSAY